MQLCWCLTWLWWWCHLWIEGRQMCCWPNSL